MNTEVLFSSSSIPAGSVTVHIGFSSIRAGNLGLHVDSGDEPTDTLARRRALEEAVGIGGRGSFMYLNQVHGTQVARAEDYDPDTYAPGDGDRLLSRQRAEYLLKNAPVADAAVSTTGRALAIMVADCIPVVLVGWKTDSELPVLAVAHAGRRGLIDGVLQRTVQEIRDAGAREVRAWLGPSICGNCYEVPEQLRTECAAIIPEVFARSTRQTPALDLPTGAVAVLRSLGVPVEVELAACTYERPELYSHRGFTNRGERPGRIAGLIWVS